AEAAVERNVSSETELCADDIPFQLALPLISTRRIQSARRQCVAACLVLLGARELNRIARARQRDAPAQGFRIEAGEVRRVFTPELGARIICEHLDAAGPIWEEGKVLPIAE